MKLVGYPLFILLSIFVWMQAAVDDQVYIILKKESKYKNEPFNDQEVLDVFQEQDIQKVRQLAQSKGLEKYIVLENVCSAFNLGLGMWMWSEYFLGVMVKRSELTWCDKFKYRSKIFTNPKEAQLIKIHSYSLQK